MFSMRTLLGEEISRAEVSETRNKIAWRELIENEGNGNWTGRLKLWRKKAWIMHNLKRIYFLPEPLEVKNWSRSLWFTECVLFSLFLHFFPRYSHFLVFVLFLAHFLSLVLDSFPSLQALPVRVIVIETWFRKIHNSVHPAEYKEIIEMNELE